MRAVILNCTLNPSPAKSSTEALASPLIAELERHGVGTELIRIADHDVRTGILSDMGGGDAWPAIRAKIVAAEILVIATPTWLGHPASTAQRVLERMDAMLSETNDDGLPVAFNKAAGVVVTGNEDGAHHVIAEVAQGLIDIGFTVPGQAWAYWNMGPGPGPSYNETDHKHDYSEMLCRNAARNLIAVAKGLQASPLPKPESASG